MCPTASVPIRMDGTELMNNSDSACAARSSFSASFRLVMSTKVTTQPASFPSSRTGCDQYSLGKQVPFAFHITSSSTCVQIGKLPAGDVHKGDDAAGELPILPDRMRPIFAGETGAICLPHHLVVDVRSPSLTKGAINLTALFRKRRFVRITVMNQTVHVLSQ